VDVAVVFEAVEDELGDVCSRGTVPHPEGEVGPVAELAGVGTLGESGSANDRPSGIAGSDQFDVVTGVFEDRPCQEFQQGAHDRSTEAHGLALLADAGTDERHEPVDPVLVHRGESVSTSLGQEVVRPIGSLSEDTHDRIDGFTVAYDRTFDVRTVVHVALDHADAVVLPDCGRETCRVASERDHSVSAFQRLFDEWATRSPGRAEYGDSHTRSKDAEDIYLQLRIFEVWRTSLDFTQRYNITSMHVQLHMTGTDGLSEVPELSSGLSREEALALRESFDSEAQARIQRTVAELLDLFGKTHTMAVLSAFAFAEGPLRFSDLETKLDIAPNTLSTRLQDLTEAGLLDREAYDEVPPRVEYTPTEKAESLFPVFAHLHHWAIEHEL